MKNIESDKGEDGYVLVINVENFMKNIESLIMFLSLAVAFIEFHEEY